MKLLREILYKVEINSVVGNTSLSINKIEFDSRLISDGDIYIAITGVNVDVIVSYHKQLKTVQTVLFVKKFLIIKLMELSMSMSNHQEKL